MVQSVQSQSKATLEEISISQFNMEHQNLGLQHGVPSIICAKGEKVDSIMVEKIKSFTMLLGEHGGGNV